MSPWNCYHAERGSGNDYIVQWARTPSALALSTAQSNEDEREKVALWLP